MEVILQSVQVVKRPINASPDALRAVKVQMIPPWHRGFGGLAVRAS
jgi:hypothetical protein